MAKVFLIIATALLTIIFFGLLIWFFVLRARYLKLEEAGNPYCPTRACPDGSAPVPVEPVVES